jgi:hypothetical protein
MPGNTSRKPCSSQSEIRKWVHQLRSISLLLMKISKSLSALSNCNPARGEVEIASLVVVFVFAVRMELHGHRSTSDRHKGSMWDAPHGKQIGFGDLKTKDFRIYLFLPASL